MFKIVFSQEALYQLKKLDNRNAGGIIEKTKETVENPLHYFKRLRGREEYKLRVGNYRIIANIMQKEKTIFVRSLGHRKNVYK